MRNENTTISIAKGIGISLVLLGHFTFIPEIKRIIYCFHMPLFFFLSGYLFQDREMKELPRYIFKKIRNLYVPFVLCNLFALLFHNGLCKLGVYATETTYTSAKAYISQAFKVLLCIEMEDIVAPMWFLPILMGVSVAYFIIRAVSKMLGKSELITTLASLFLYIISYVLITYGKTQGIWRAVILVGIGLFVFHSGHYYKIREARIKQIFHKRAIVLLCFLAIVCASFVVDINMIQMRFANPASFILCAVLGINVVLYVALKIDESKGKIKNLIRFLGNNSLTILEWHYCGALITSFLQAALSQGAIEGIIFYHENLKWVWFISYCCTGMGLPLLIIFVRNAVKRME